MADPLDVLRKLFGAAATIAPALPPEVALAVRVVDAGVSLAVAFAKTGRDPLVALATMERMVTRYDEETRAGLDDLDRALDAMGVPRPAPAGAPPAPADVHPATPQDSPTGALRTPTAPFGHPSPEAAPVAPPEGTADDTPATP